MGGSDGSLVFDTELDNTGFDRGSDKLLNAVKELTAAVDRLGKDMAKSFQSASGPIAEAAKTAKNGANDLTRAAAAYDTALAKQQKRIDATKAKLTDYYKAVAAVQANTDETLRQTTSDDQAARVLEIEEIELNNINEKYAKLLAELKDLEAEYRKLAEAKARAAEAGSAEPATQETVRDGVWRSFIDAMREAQPLTQQISGAFSAIKERIAEIGPAFAAFGERVKGAFSSGLSAAASFGAAAKNAILHPLQTLNQTVGSAAAGIGSLLRSGLQALPGALHALGSAAVTAGAALVKFTARAASAAATLAKNLLRAAGNAIASGFKKITSSLGGIIKNGKGAGLTANALAKSLRSIKNLLIGRIKRTFISAIFNEAKEALQTLARFSDAFNTSMSNIKNSTKEMAGNLAVTLGNLIQTVEPMITAVVNALSTAIKYLNAFFAMLGGKTTMTVAKKQTDSYRNSLDKTSKAAKETKKQLASFDELNVLQDQSSKNDEKNDGSDLFEEVPIDSVLPEGLKKFFEELKDLWENGEFFKFGEKLAEGLNSITQALDDWINGTFRPKGVEWAGNIAEILNGLINGWDAGLAGKLLADGLNAIFDIVNTFLEKFDAENFGKRIGELINGFFDNVEWDLLSRTFANGLNSIADIIHGFVTEVNWAEIGDSIALFIQSFFDKIDWDKAAEAIKTGINGIITTIHHVLDGVDWNGIGQKIGKFISDIFTGISWEEAGATFTGFFTGLVDLALGILDGLDWGAITGAISGFIQGAVNELGSWIKSQDWKQLGESFWDNLKSAIEGLDIKKLVNSIVTFISDAIISVADLVAGIDWSDVVATLFDVLGEVIEGFPLVGLLKAIGTLIVTLVMEIPSILVGALAGISGLIGSLFEDLGLDSIAGFFKGIGDALKNVGTWLKENLVDPVVNWVKNLFGIHSPSTVFAEIGGFLIEGLLQGIKNAWNTITQFFTTAVEGLKNLLSAAWNAIKQTASTAWEEIKNAVAEKWSAVKDAVSKTADSIKTTLSTAWNNIKSTASTAWEDIKKTISDKWNSAKETISKTAETIKNTLSKVWDNIKTATGNAWDKVKSTVTEKFNAIKSSISSTANEMKTAVGNAWSSIQTATTQKWNTLKSTVTNLWNGLKNSFKTSDWSGIGRNLVSGLQSGLSSAWSSLRSTVSSLASGLTSSLRSIFSIHSPSKVWAEIGEYLDLGLKEGLEGEKKTVLRTVSDVAAAMSDTMSGSSLSTGRISVGGVTDTLTDFSERVVNSIDRLINQLHAIAESVTFRVPEIAAGTVVPYRVAAAAGSTSGSGNIGGGISTDDLRQVLEELFEEYGGEMMRLIVNIGDETLIDKIIRGINRRTRSNGDEVIWG